MIEIDFVQKDRLTKLLLSEKWYIVLSVALVVPCIPIAGFLIQSLFTDFHPELRILEDFGYVAVYFLSFPIVLVFVNLYIHGFKEACRLLFENRIVTEKESINESLNKRVADVQNNIINRVLPHILAFGFALMEFIFFVCMKDYTWYSISLFGKFNISGLLIVIPYYCFDFLLAVVLTRLLTIFRILMNVFREDVKINPLHHDNCGGLSILGNISQKLYIGTFLMGFVLVFGIYQNMILYDVSIFHFTNIILMFVYMLLSTLIFFLPLIATHRPMQKKKDEILNYIMFSPLHSYQKSNLFSYTRGMNS